jgi:uncharacterized zinc-type alcohol dehydrogenase-like protein
LEVPAFSLIMGQKSSFGFSGRQSDCSRPNARFQREARHLPVTETFPMARVNDAFEHLRSGKARYRIVLLNEHA